MGGRKEIFPRNRIEVGHFYIDFFVCEALYIARGKEMALNLWFFSLLSMFFQVKLKETGGFGFLCLETTMKIRVAHSRIQPHSVKSSSPCLLHLACSQYLRGDANSSVSPWGALSEHTCLPFNLLWKPATYSDFDHTAYCSGTHWPNKAASVGLAVIPHGASVTSSSNSLASYRTFYPFFCYSPPRLFSHKPASSEAGSFLGVKKTLLKLISLWRLHYYKSTWCL